MSVPKLLEIEHLIESLTPSSKWKKMEMFVLTATEQFY